MAVDAVHAFGAICIFSRAVRSRESWTERGEELSYEPELGVRHVRPTVRRERENALVLFTKPPFEKVCFVDPSLPKCCVDARSDHRISNHYRAATRHIFKIDRTKGVLPAIGDILSANRPHWVSEKLDFRLFRHADVTLRDS
jgi:hypothetical protein